MMYPRYIYRIKDRLCSLGVGKKNVLFFHNYGGWVKLVNGHFFLSSPRIYTENLESVSVVVTDESLERDIQTDRHTDFDM